MSKRHLLDQFSQPKAKIDFITIPLGAIKTYAEARSFSNAVKGKISVPKVWRGEAKSFLTIQDPTAKDLQFMIDEYYNIELRAIEIAIDFSLKDGSNDMGRLLGLHSHLTRCLFPERHTAMERVTKRKYFDIATEKIRPSAMTGGAGEATNYWSNVKRSEQVRLYVKTLDHGKPVDQYSVRLEVTLNRGGCQNANVHRVGLVPHFVSSMRMCLSRYFMVAKGIKVTRRRCRSLDPRKRAEVQRLMEKESRRADRGWNIGGAAWAAKHGYKVIPDTAFNRPIGVALKQLRETLSSLRLPAKVADPDAWINEKLAIYEVASASKP